MGAIKKIGILTGGGDCPGLNAAIRAVVRSAYNKKIKVIGFAEGWSGVIEGRYEPLTLNSISGILSRGGTFLGSSRVNPVTTKGALTKIKKNLKKLSIDALIVIGGDGTLRAALELYEKHNINVIGIPKTIDNDLMETDDTIGFDTAVTIATEAIDRLHTTAESHRRVMIVEVMGRDTGWIATQAGIAAGADYILIPEVSVSLDDVVKDIKHRHSRGKTFSIVVVAEGAKFDCPDHHKVHKGKENIGRILAQELEKKIGVESRVIILGYTQRGGTPTAYDRLLATRFGVRAVELAVQKKFGQMVALHGSVVRAVSLKKAVRKLKTCDLKLFEIAKTFFG